MSCPVEADYNFLEGHPFHFFLRSLESLQVKTGHRFSSFVYDTWLKKVEKAYRRIEVLVRTASQCHEVSRQSIRDLNGRVHGKLGNCDRLWTFWHSWSELDERLEQEVLTDA